MPHTAAGRYYKIVNGKRQYNPKYDKKVAAAPRARQPAAKSSTRTLRRATEPRFGGALKGVLEGGGSALGSAIGGAPGAVAGGLAGSVLSKVMGLGAYEIKENVFLQGRLPMMVNDSPSGGTIIRHTEYLGDIVTSSVANTFNLQAFALNPAVEGTFPWLSQIAANYEQYGFEGLLFQFRSTSADALNSVNTALGSVMMATNYDSADAPFASKAEMLNYEFSTSCKPSESCIHMIECAPDQTVLSKQYTRPHAVPPGEDIRMYDLGQFQIATTGFQGTSVNIGELHCTYQVRLLKPKLFVALGNEINYAHYTNTVGVVNATPLGTASAVVVADNIGLVITSTTVTFPVSRIIESYWVYIFHLGTVGAAAALAPAITLANAQTFAPINTLAPQNGAAVILNMSNHFKISTFGNGTAPVLTWGVGGTLPGGTSSMRLIIVQSPNDLI